jgi:hypothetical protein
MSCQCRDARQGLRRRRQTQGRGRDHVGRNLRKIAGETALAFKARTKRRCGEMLYQARHDAAADIHAAQCAQHHRDIGGDGANVAQKYSIASMQSGSASLRRQSLVN